MQLCTRDRESSVAQYKGLIKSCAKSSFSHTQPRLVFSLIQQVHTRRHRCADTPAADNGNEHGHRQGLNAAHPPPPQALQPWEEEGSPNLLECASQARFSDFY